MRQQLHGSPHNAPIGYSLEGHVVKWERQGAWRGGSTHATGWLCDLRKLYSSPEHLSFEIKERDVLEQCLIEERTEHSTSHHAKGSLPKGTSMAKKKKKKKVMTKMNESIQ